MVAAAATEATRGRRLRLFSGLRVPPICLAHECAQAAAAAGSAFQRLPGSGTWAFHLRPFSSSPPQPARSSFSGPLLPGPPHRKKPGCLSWVSLSLFFGPQMRKTVLPVFGFPNSQEIPGGGPSHHFLAKHPASWRRNPPQSARTQPGGG